MSEEAVAPIPNLQLQQHAFVLANPALADRHSSALEALLAGIEADEMAPYLRVLSQAPTPVVRSNPTLLAELEAKNKEQLQKIDEKLEYAQKNLGESEISDALRAKATYLARIGEKDEAIKAHQVALEKTAGLGSKIDLQLAIVRIGFFHGDHKLVSTNLEAAQLLVDDAGDWDRRNRLKVYRGINYISVRNFKEGGDLLLDVISTFTATELIDYDGFVTLCILAGTLTLPRKDLQKKLMESPEVISVIPNVPAISNYCDSLYKCEYSDFFKALAVVEENFFLASRILYPHANYYTREMRIRAYGQLLESYRSVTLKNLSSAFGVSEKFIDNDLSRFIAGGRLNCSIDRVNGVVESNRPDRKNANYEVVVKQGDVLLTSIQRLSRIIG